MNKLLKQIKAVPKYGWICGIAYFALQYGMYRLANYLSIMLGTVRWAFIPKIPLIDDAIGAVKKLKSWWIKPIESFRNSTFFY